MCMLCLTCAEVDVLVADVDADARQQRGVDLVLKQHLHHQPTVTKHHTWRMRVGAAHLVLLANELLNCLVDLGRAWLR